MSRKGNSKSQVKGTKGERRGAKPRAPLLISDLPSGKDYLGFGTYSSAITEIIRNPDTDTPLTIAIIGKWGSGKTTLMQMVRGNLKKRNSQKHSVVWFNAWKYTKELSLWRALIQLVVAEVKTRADGEEKLVRELEDLEESIYQSIEREELGKLEINLHDLLMGTIETGAKVALSLIPGINLVEKVREALQESASKEGPSKLLSSIKRARTEVKIAQLLSIEQFQNQFSNLVDKHIAPRGRLVVFIDDLDRCLPGQAIEVLEAIKLFMDVPGCFFILGIDHETIEHGIQIRYKELGKWLDGKKYLEKIIQLPFFLPRLEVAAVESYVYKLAPNLPDVKCTQVFVLGYSQAEPNPREIKRTINSYLFLSQLAGLREATLGRINDVLLAKVVVIQHNFSKLYDLLRHRPMLIKTIENYFQEVNRQATAMGGEPDIREDKLPIALREFANNESLKNLLLLYVDERDLCFQHLTIDEIIPYFTLTRSVHSIVEPHVTTWAPEMKAIDSGDYYRGSRPDDIKNISETCNRANDLIKTGYFNKEQPGKKAQLDRFFMSRNPITNREYMEFIIATNQKPPIHWKNGTPPENIFEHPVTNVDFFDAEKYCNWLSGQTNLEYRLPTETEWEAAARGKAGLIYPWGNTFVKEKCNTSEGGIGGTTSTEQFTPAGLSPFYCADMAGNVYEWCADWFSETYYSEPVDKNPSGPISGTLKVVKGGAWDKDCIEARCAARQGRLPNTRANNIGFRVARSA